MMINSKFQKLYKQIILEQTADLTNKIIPLIKQNLNNKDVLTSIKEKDATLLKKILRFKKFKKQTLLNQLSDYITNDCECKEEILQILEDSSSKSSDSAEKESSNTSELSLEQIEQILNVLNENETCLKYADEAFGEDYITDLLKVFEENKQKACQQFKEDLMIKDQQHQNAVKLFLKKFNKATESKFKQICKSIFNLF